MAGGRVPWPRLTDANRRAIRTFAVRLRFAGA